MNRRRRDLLPFAVQEREDLVELLAALTPGQWATRSLCAQWSVRDVAVHVVSYDDLTWPQLLLTFLKGGLRVKTVNEVALRRRDELSTDDVVTLVASRVQPRGLAAALGGGIALTDTTIHHQDIRRALALPRSIPQERLRPVLDFAMSAPTIPAKVNSKGLRLVATDLDWTYGEGPHVTGPGEAVLMAAAGRAAALVDLDGPGLETLSARVDRATSHSPPRPED